MWNGILNIYKEKGYTSHDVVAKLRGIVRQKKIGHTGTLDPDAEGVLPVCLGKATRLCDMLTDQSKTYEAVLLLGKTTDTQDITGQILEERETGHLTEDFREGTKDSIYWPAIKGMRNLFAHNYGAVDVGLVWETAVSDIPVLHEFCERTIRMFRFLEQEEAQDGGMER